jgi:hypothetical protein
VTFKEQFSWPDELNVKSVIKTLHKYNCITDGKKENMNNLINEFKAMFNQLINRNSMVLNMLSIIVNKITQ